MWSDLEQRGTSKDLLTGGPVTLLGRRAEELGTKNLIPALPSKPLWDDGNVISVLSSTVATGHM